MEVRGRWFRERMAQVITGESMTEQSHRENVDINNIVKRFHRTGQLPPLLHPPVYADVTRLQAPLAERIAFSESTIATVSDYLSGLDPLGSSSSPPPGAGGPAPDGASVSSSPGP